MQSQLTFDGKPDPPQVGEWLRCREDRRWAQVYGIAVQGKPSPMLGLPMYAGDVAMEWTPGRYRITSGGDFFWTKWERVDLDEAARVAIEAALREESE